MQERQQDAQQITLQSEIEARRQVLEMQKRYISDMYIYVPHIIKYMKIYVWGGVNFMHCMHM